MSCLPTELQCLVLSYLLNMDKDEDAKTLTLLIREMNRLDLLNIVLTEYAQDRRKKCFQMSCQLGDFRACFWFIEKFLSSSCTIRDLVNALYVACAEGHLHIVTWLTKHLHKYNNVNCRNAFFLACENGHLSVAQWLKKHFHITREDTIAKPEDNTSLPLEGQRFICAGWFKAELILRQFYYYSAGKTCALQVICPMGHLVVAQWLTKELDLSVEDAKRYENDAFRQTCANGHLLTAQWVARHFKLSIGDIKTYGNYAFREACAHGHFLVAQWLAKEFQLTKRDARNYRRYAFFYACKRGHLMVVKWLTKQFGFTCADLVSGGDCAFTNACENGHLFTAQWLAKEFDLAMKFFWCPAFANACRNGNLPMVKWLAREFDLRTKSVTIVNIAYRGAYQNGRFLVTKWLEKYFQYW